MRFLLKAEIPVQEGNELAIGGSLGRTIESIVTEMKPESAYFIAENGKRTALIFFDMEDPSQIPAVAEPWFIAFNASVDITPAMVAQDLKKAESKIEHAVKVYS
jgi:hypothetical protein